MAELFPITPIGAMDISIDDNSVVLGDFTQNRAIYFDSPSFTTFSMVIPADTLAERKVILDFFKLHKGKLLAFWLRTYKKEFTLYADASAGQRILKVFTSTSFMEASSGRTIVIYIEEINYKATVVSTNSFIDDNGISYDELTLSTDLPSAILKYSGTIIERLYFVRFLQDTLNFEYYDKWTSTVKLGFKELLYEYELV